MIKNKPLNRNSIRSVNLITNTLLKMMENKNFNDISISEITKEAGLVRNTFYSHFSRKEDVIIYHIYKLFEQELIDLNLDYSSKNIDFVEIYFNFWGNHLFILDLLKKNNLLELLNLLEFFLDDFNISTYINQLCPISEQSKKYSTSVYMNVLSSIIIKWVNTGKEETPKTLSKIFYELLTI